MMFVATNWAFALAVFAALRDENVSELKRDLKPHLYDDMRSALKYLKNDPAILEPHRAIGA